MDEKEDKDPIQIIAFVKDMETLSTIMNML